MNQQPLTEPCDRCGARCAVTQESPWEFAWSCACGAAGVVSWAHVSAPPEFDRELPLFAERA